MTVKFFCPRWGAEDMDWELFLAKVKQAGYHGIEWTPYSRPDDHLEVVRLLEKYGLEFVIVMAVTGQEGQGFETYPDALEQQLRDLASIRTDTLAPLHISVQMGREYYTSEQVSECLERCRRVSNDRGLPVYQETHRNKWSFAAHTVYPRLLEQKDFSLTLDVSHWFCVSESYLEDQQPAVELAIRRARHVHARVGHTEGPQVWDPAAPEYAQALQEHLRIWDKWVALMRESGAACCTITPEFGPPPYLVFGNRPGTPFEEQWRINLWMKNFLRDRYKND